MTHALRVGQANQTALFRAYNADWSPRTDFNAATAGATLSVYRAQLSSVSIASLSDKAADDSTHADGAIRRIEGNLYSVDLPDAATASQCESICIKGSFTGGIIDPIPHALVGYDPTVAAVGSLTTLGANAPANWINNAALADNAITAPKIANDAIANGKIANGAISSGKIAAGAIGSSQIANSAIGPSQIAANAITSAKIAADAIGATQIAANAITSAKIAVNAIGASQIADNAITASKIADQALTSTKFASGAFDAVWGVTSRTLSAFGFSVTVGTNNDKTGYGLTTSERDAIAVEVESHLLDEGDSQMLINAIVGAIGNTNIDQAVLVAAIRADLERSGGNLNTLLARIAGTIRTAADDATAETAQTATIRSGLARTTDVQVTVNPTINPTLLATDSVEAIRSGMATSQQVSDAAQSIIDHGDGDGGWSAVGSGGSGGGTNGVGQYRISVTTTADGNGVHGVRVSIVGTTTFDHTSTSGTATLNVNPGSYTLRFTVPDNYQPVADFVIDDLASDVEVPIVLTRRSYPSSPVAGTCEILDFVYESDGQTPVVAASVRAIADKNAKLTNSGILSAVVSNAITDNEGRFVLRLPQRQSIAVGKRYTIEVKRDSRIIYSVTGFVPNTLQCTLLDIANEDETDD